MLGAMAEGSSVAVGESGGISMVVAARQARGESGPFGGEHCHRRYASLHQKDSG